MPSIFQMAFFTGLIFILDETELRAQYQASKYELGISAGTLVYQGDLTPTYTGDYKSLKPALTLSVSRMTGKHLALSGNLTFGKLAADESRYLNPQWRQDRSFNFTTRMTEFSTLLSWNFFKTDEYHQPRFTPYIFAGAGLTFMHTRKNWSKVNTAVYGEGSQVQAGLAADTLQPANRIIAVLPVGVGIKYRLSSLLSFNAAINYRITASDYIDGFKYSGNAGKTDSYYGISAGLLYTFGRYKCPPVK